MKTKNQAMMDICKAMLPSETENIPQEKTSREIAMAWWNKLGNKDKDRFQRKCGLNRPYVTLTGREIEGIYNSPIIKSIEESRKENLK